MSGSARLVINRPAGAWRDRLRAYHVLLDGQRLGVIRAGETIGSDIAAGPHLVQAKIDWSGSPPLEFDAEPGTEIVLRVEPAGNAFMAWQAYGSTSWLRLTRIS